MWDLHQIGRPVDRRVAREAERVVALARDAGVPVHAAIALARDVLRNAPPPPPAVSISRP